MRRLLLFSLIFFCFLKCSVQAQNSRVSELTEKLHHNISSLATNSSKDFFSRSNNTREQLNNVLVLQQSEATAAILLLLIKDNHPNSELRDAAEALDERFGKYNADTVNRILSQQIKKDIDELINEIKKSPPQPDKKTGETSGKLFWQGTIDDEVQLIVRGSTVQIKTISGKEYNDAIFSFTSPLPEENVQVFVNKKDGRGTAKVIQQPTAENDFTAIIQVSDKNGGARDYGLEIYWTK